MTLLVYVYAIAMNEANANMKYPELFGSFITGMTAAKTPHFKSVRLREIKKQHRYGQYRHYPIIYPYLVHQNHYLAKIRSSRFPNKQGTFYGSGTSTSMPTITMTSM
jgi:hypothetical protein